MSLSVEQIKELKRQAEIDIDAIVQKLIADLGDIVFRVEVDTIYSNGFGHVVEQAVSAKTSITVKI